MNIVLLIAGIVLGFILSAVALAAFVLIVDAVWQSDREDQSTLKNRQC